MLIAERDAQQWLARLQRQPLFDLVARKFELVLVLIHTRAVVVDDCGIRGVEPQRRVELIERLLVKAVDAQRQSGHQVDVPVVCGGLEKLFDSVARRLLFTTR